MINHATQTDRANLSFWQERLKTTHAALVDAIEELAQLVRGGPPDREELVNVRWRVSQASLSRRLLWGQIHTLLARRVEVKFERDLRRLQEADFELIKASTKHVSRWTVDAIVGDWEGYCRASEIMQFRMLDALAQERRLLYPILETLMKGGDTRHRLEDERPDI